MPREIITEKQIKGYTALLGTVGGPSMLRLFSELSGGRTVGATPHEDGAVLQSEVGLKGYRQRLDLTVHALALGYTSAVAVLKSEDREGMSLTGSLLDHPELVVGIQTNCFTVDKQPVPAEEVATGEPAGVRYLALIKRGSQSVWGLREEVADRAREILSEEVGKRYIGEID